MTSFNRRQFVSATIATSAAALATGPNAAATAIDRLAARDPVFRLTTAELVHAVRRWADSEGFEFRWSLMPDVTACKRKCECIDLYWLDDSWHELRDAVDLKTGERLWRCDIYRGGELWSERECGWYSATATDCQKRAEAENELAIEVLAEHLGIVNFSTGPDRDDESPN